MPKAETRLPLASYPETQPFIEQRRTNRRRQDNLRSAKAIVASALISSIIWAIGVGAVVAIERADAMATHAQQSQKGANL
jgi:hypothetical protein